MGVFTIVIATCFAAASAFAEPVQMLIEKDELQQEQEGVIFVFFIKIHSQTFHFSALFLL